MKTGLSPLRKRNTGRKFSVATTAVLRETLEGMHKKTTVNKIKGE